jgi:hypothetical protein
LCGPRPRVMVSWMAEVAPPTIGRVMQIVEIGLIQRPKRPLAPNSGGDA